MKATTVTGQEPVWWQDRYIFIGLYIYIYIHNIIYIYRSIYIHMFTFIYVMYNHISEIPSEEMYHMTMTRHDHAVNTANWRDECLEETWWKPCYICYVSGHEFFVIKKGSAGWICELVSKNRSTHLDITGRILSWSLCDLVPFGHRFSRFLTIFHVSLSHCLISSFRWF